MLIFNSYLGAFYFCTYCADSIYRFLLLFYIFFIYLSKAKTKKCQKDFIKRINLILSFLSEIEPYEKSRVEAIKNRIISNLENFSVDYDKNRFEQELIYYIEKLDITEEKVRLDNHCKYFLRTLEESNFQGKQLTFISQEIGREINTIGSKANNTEIQQIVVRMKDELEKIREQLANIL